MVVIRNQIKKLICLWSDVADPDDGKFIFQIEILDINNNTLKKASYRNNWGLFDSRDNYVQSLRNNFIFNASNETNLWRIQFEKQYPVEIDHSFLVIMSFVIPYNSTLLYNNSINIQIESKLTSTKRTCRTKTEMGSIKKLLKGFNKTSIKENILWENGIKLIFISIYQISR